MRSAVTGAFSYTGRYITRLLLSSGQTVVNLTNHPGRLHAFGLEDLARISTHALDFQERSKLSRALEGVDVLYCTYWIRFARGEDTHERAAERLDGLFQIARGAGVRKIVFSSHTRASRDSPFVYIRGKARAEEALRACGTQYAVVRPCGIFGETPHESILMNNAAWVLRRSPLFLIAGSGEECFQPVHVCDLAELMCDLGQAHSSGEEVDACGPDVPTARELFTAIARACGSRSIVMAPGLSTWLVTRLTQPINHFTGDLLLDDDDLDLMYSGLTRAGDPHDPRIARRRSLFRWLDEVGPSLGREYISSIRRYYH